MKSLLLTLTLLVTALGTFNAQAQCTRTSSYGSGTASGTCGASVTLSSCNWATEYARIFNVVAGRTYRVNSSISSDWVTIRHTTSSGTMVSFAVQGTNWVAPVSGTYYAHFSTNSSCGSNTSCRATSVTTVSGCAPATCANTSPYGSATINSNGGSVTISTCSYAGEYSTISGAVSGQTLRFTSSVASDYITVRSGSSGGAVVAQGNTPLVFTNTFTGTLYAHWNTNSSCGTQSSCRTTTVQCTSCTPSAPDPCASISSLSCGATSSYSLTGSTGAWNNYGGLFSTPGDEQVFSFTPTTTGVHTINLTVSSGYVDLFFKTNSCSGSSGWNYVDDVLGSASNNITLTAGITYYFLLDDENTTASSGSISITCPQPTPNPCSNITNIASCGVSQNINITQGNGVWSSFGGPYSTPGRENIFTFTPTVTASYPVTITNNGSGWIDLFVKSASSGCNSSGWTYIDDISGTATNNLALSAGTTYYFLLDDEDIFGSTGSIIFGCPCIGLPIDASYTYNGNFTISGNTTGACNNSALRPSEDLIYEINISCNGNYTFQTCNGAGWDTYLYLTDQPGGGGSVLAFNDDNCGLQSSISVALNAGQYYLVVEGFSSTSNGAFTASVTGTGSAPSISGSASNVSCNGGSDGSITANINGNNNIVSATLNGSYFNGSATDLAAGTYIVSATNCWGTSTQSFTVTEPTLLTSSASSGSIACNGGTTTVTVTAKGGTAPYNFSSFDAFINEIHYDNSSTDVGEAVEIAGTAGMDLSGWSICLYNGSNGTLYNTTNLSGILANTSNGFGFATEYISGIQNGAPDGIALIDNQGNVVQFLSYEGSFTATNGPAAGMTSTDIGVSETGSTPAGFSLQLQGNGSSYDDFSWASPQANTFGAANTGQSFSGGGSQSSNVFTNVAAGTYEYTVTDANGCTSTASITITEPPLLTASSVSGNIACFGGSTDITVSASGGTSPYMYTAINAFINEIHYDNASSDVGEAIEIAGTAGLDLTGWSICLYNGSNGTLYNTRNLSGVLANSNNGFGFATEYISGIQNGSPDGVALVNDQGDVVQFLSYEGSFTATDGPAVGMTSTNIGVSEASSTPVGYSLQLQGNGSSYNDFSWASAQANTFGAANTGQSFTAGGGAQSSNIFNNVTAGTHSYLVTDANGCMASTTIVVTQPTLLTSNSTSGSILCFGGTTTVTVSATGGTAPYTGTGNYTVSAGTYSYTVTDANGCTSITNITVTEPPLLEAASTSGAILCFGGTTTITVSATGGTAPYTGTGNYTVSAGTYSYTVTDANGCSSTTSITVTQPTLLTSSSTSGTILCYGGTTTVTVSGNGGTPPYSGTGNYTVSAGSYTYTVTDANGCTSTTSISISQPPQLIAEAGNDQIVYYGYAPMACATLNGSSVGGTGTASYEWFDDNGQSVGNTASINVCPSTTTTYTVVATDANGCTASDDVTICVIDVVCYAGNSGNAKVEMCHNGHTICINANAVAAHLAHGSTLGSCSEINGCGSKMASNIEQRDEFIEVYPNPTEGILTINTHYENDEMIEIQVYNMMGEVVLNYTLTNGQNQIDLSNFSNGIYIVKHKEDIYKVIKH